MTPAQLFNRNMIDTWSILRHVDGSEGIKNHRIEEMVRLYPQLDRDDAEAIWNVSVRIYKKENGGKNAANF